MALRSAMDPVPGVSRVGTLGTREAEEDEAVVGSTDETENDVLVQVTTKTDLDTGSTWACEADRVGQGGAHGREQAEVQIQVR